MITGFFGKTRPTEDLLTALGADTKEDQGNVAVVEGDGLWACLVRDQREQLDPPARSDQLTAVAADPIFLGSPEEGYRRASGDELIDGLRRQGVSFFRDVVNNVCAAVVETRRNGAILHLVSHRIGPARMYHCCAEGGIAFSSDAKTLARAVSAEPDPMGLWSIIMYGAAPEPLSVLQGIRTVPVGQAATFREGTNEPTYTPVLCLDFGFEPAESDDGYLVDAERALLAGAKAVAQLDTSMTVSGGIDSSLFLCMMQKALGHGRKGYNCRFGDEDPEAGFAQSVADASQTDLKSFDFPASQVMPTIRFAAECAVHPFSDFSAMPVAFLLKRIAEDRSGRPWVFDGNGGDDCFGVAGQERVRQWRLLARVSRILGSPSASLWMGLGLWKRYGPAELLTRKLYQASAPDTRLAPFVFGHVRTTVAESGWWQTVSDLFSANADAYVAETNRNDPVASFYVIQLTHVCSRLWTAKSVGPANELGLSIVYPYLWRDVLASMAKIPWRLKVRDGVVKWPLRMMLEEFMPKDFIYRPKSGFVPPWLNWLRDKEIRLWVRDILLDPSAHMTAVLRADWIDRTLAHLGESDAAPPMMVLNTLWGALATELWLRRTLA